MNAIQHSAGFPPIARVDARVLVLGSLPGQRSLRELQYYAHPQNAFWKIMEKLFDISGVYEERCEALTRQGIALWDVLQRSVRPGSMDADIHLDTAVCNDFATFFSEHRHIVRIAFNGRKAEELFRRLVLPDLESAPELVLLPSTSPAYASMSFEKKLEDWRRTLASK